MAVERPAHDDELCRTRETPCFACHVGSLTLGLPSDFPSKTYSKAEPRRADNSYAKGIPVSHRPDGSQMPYLTANGDVMYQNEFNRKRRLIEDNKRKAAQVGLAPSTR